MNCGSPGFELDLLRIDVVIVHLLLTAAMSTPFPIWPAAQSLLIVTNCPWRELLPGEASTSPHLVCCLGWVQTPALA